MWSPESDYEQIEVLYESERTTVARARDKENPDQTVILKTLTEPNPTPRELLLMRREFEIAKTLQGANFPRILTPEDHFSTRLLVQQDIGGQSLERILEGQRFDIDEFLELAIELSDAVARLHDQGVMHRDINPSNIIYNGESGQLQLIDFGLAMRLDWEHTAGVAPRHSSGTLAYMSPEQTGRTNRLIDYRADLYSLGVTLYEMVTGRLPFQSRDPAELIHLHLAHHPPSPRQLVPHVPEQVSRIIMKLLSKAPEDRYQSAHGLRVDLERCQRQWKQRGVIPIFDMGTQDVWATLRISQRLYGRKRELGQLRERMHRIRRIPRMLTLVTGEPGVGKTALIAEVQAPVTGHNAWFVSGKFDPQLQSIPYTAVGRAMGKLITRILGQSEVELQKWRRRIDEALGDDATLIANMIPELDTLLQSADSGASIDPMEAKYRFRHAFRRFVSVFCNSRRPLTLFLDDLQWADEASLELIEVLLTDEEIQHLHIIGAYRDDEVGPEHRLVCLLDSLREAGMSVKSIELSPLDFCAVRQLVCDTFYTTTEEAEPLAQVLYQKTSGNPYFVHQFLMNLVETELLWFETDDGQWKWDLKGIHTLPAAENVVDILSERLETLEKDSQRVMIRAALLGTRFSLETLAAVCEQSQSEVFHKLEPAIEMGIVVPLEEAILVDSDDLDSKAVVPELVFSHDRVREAAADLVDEADRPALHLHVGRMLKSRLSSDSSSAMLFLVVNHLNEGIELLDADDEKKELVSLNFRAGMEALDAQAFAAASEYLTVASRCLGDESGWEQEPELARQVYLNRARADSLGGDFESAKRSINTALEHLDDPVERAPFQSVLIEQYTLQSEFDRAVKVAQSALESLGEPLLLEDLDNTLADTMIDVERRLAGRSIDCLRDMPTDDDPYTSAALRVLASVQPAAGLLELRLLLVVGLKATAITLEIGIHPASAVGLAIYGTALCSQHQMQRGYEAGCLALELARHFDRQSDISHVTFIVAAMIFPWSHPLQESMPLLHEGRRAGLRSGNYIFAGFNAMLSVVYGFFMGKNLEDGLRNADDAVELSAHTGNVAAVELAAAARLIMRNLAGYTSGPDVFCDERYESAQSYLRQCDEHGNRSAIVTFEISRAYLEYLYGDNERALDRLETIGEQIDALVGTFDTGRFAFVYALVLADRCADMPDSPQRREYLEKIAELRHQLAGYAEHAPENFLHKQLLVDAELGRLKGELKAPMQLYDRAIEEANQNQMIHLVALANERAALFWRSWNKDAFAADHLREASYYYQLWQARRKVELFQKQYDELLATPGDAEITSSDQSSGEATVDLDSVLRASELIAGQLDVADLLPTLLQVALSNAGAERGAFLVVADDRLCASVEGESDVEPRLLDPPQHLDEWRGGPRSIVRYVRRVGEPLVLGRASADPRFRDDPYIEEVQPRSVLCIPVEESGEIRGVLYAENNLADEMFTEERTRVLTILAGHMAIALHKAHLYASLHEEKERFRQLAENIREVFWLMDWPSAQIVYVSPAFEAVWGRPVPQQAISIERWVEQITDSDRERVADALRDDAPRGEYDETYRIARPSGSLRWIRDRGFPIYDTEGNIFRIAGVANDITQEHEVTQMKDEFISVVSHELRTPLTPITGIFSMLTRQYDDVLPDDVVEMAELGLRNSRRLLTLIDDLLDIQKLSMERVDFELQLLDAREIVEEAVDLNRPLGELHEVDIELHTGEDPVLIEIDNGRMLQIMTNLLSNAIKFSEADDTVDVEVGAVGDRAKISVTDRGPGIPREARERIFEKFTQVDSSLTREHGGTGLGLAIARSLVERMGGEIDVDTQMGRGTTFRVYFPLATG